jgi:uncharacterized delta-60 repeat protein
MSRRLLLALSCALAAAPLLTLAADGQLDTGFGTAGATFVALDGVEGHELRTGTALTLPDGELLLGGSRNKIILGNPDPHMRATIVRLRADGTPDASFGNIPSVPGLLVLPDLVPGDQMQIIESMRHLADGSIIVAGSANAFGPLTGFVIKLAADGSFDTKFGTQGIALVPGTYFHALGIDSQGRIVVGGEKSIPNFDQAIVARFKPDGRLDSEFGPAADGIVRLTTSGTGQNGYISTLQITADDHIVVGGNASVPDPELGDIFWASITRLDSDGYPDAGFATAGVRKFMAPDTASSYNGVSKLLLTLDGKITFGGYYVDGETGVNAVLGRFNADGSDDTTFGAPATPGYSKIALAPDAWTRYVSGLERQSDGKLVVSVSYSSPGVTAFMALRTEANGTLDASFANAGIFELDLAPNGIYNDSTALTLQAGRPIVAGVSMRSTSSNLVDLAAVRLENDLIFSDRFED